MKLNKLFLIGAAAVTLTACSSDDESSGVEKKDTNTYAGLVVSLQQPVTKAAGVTQDQKDNVGRDAENNISNITLLSSLSGNVWNDKKATAPDASSITSDAFWKTTATTYTTGAFAASVGTQTMALVLNDPGSGLGLLDETFGTANNAVANIAALSTDNNFVMTSAKATNTVLDGLSEATVNAQNSPDATKNVFGFDVERIVSQAIVTKAASLAPATATTANSRVNVNLDELTYAVVNGATSINIFLDNAGSRQIELDTDGNYRYVGLHSAIHTFLCTSGTTWADGKTQTLPTAHLIRLGNYSKFEASMRPGTSTVAERVAERTTKNAALGGYAAVPVLAAGTTQYAISGSPVVTDGTTRGIYFLENSASSAGYTKDNKDYGFYRLTYAKVYGIVTPVKIYGVKYQNDGSDNLEETWDIIEYTIASSLPHATPSTFAEKLENAHTYVIGTTFYRGAKDDYLYANARGAMIGADGNKWDPATPGDKAAKAQAYWTYLDARCGWRALLNRQTNDNGDDDITKAVVSANTRRNNIYLLEISAFQQIGMPYDPSDPDDPNLPEPDPDDPDDPTPPDPDDPDIEKEHTYMKVMATVLDWNVVKRSVIFY